MLIQILFMYWRMISSINDIQFLLAKKKKKYMNIGSTNTCTKNNLRITRTFYYFCSQNYILF